MCSSSASRCACRKRRRGSPGGPGLWVLSFHAGRKFAGSDRTCRRWQRRAPAHLGLPTYVRTPAHSVPGASFVDVRRPKLPNEMSSGGNLANLRRFWFKLLLVFPVVLIKTTINTSTSPSRLERSGGTGRNGEHLAGPPRHPILRSRGDCCGVPISRQVCLNVATPARPHE